MATLTADRAAAAPVVVSDVDETGAMNMAFGRSATQSSTSAFSRPGGPEVDAAGALSAEMPDDYGFHTELELFPWWQVDLGEDVEVTRIVIHNRVAACERLRHFTVLLSRDGASFDVAYRKLDNRDVGADGEPLSIELEGPWVARLVRIRADAHVPLHLRRCEVFGRAADERARSGDAERRRRKDLSIAAHSAGRKGSAYDVGGFAIFGDAERYTPVILEALQRGDYEGREREIVRAVLQPGDRVLEVGSAVGAVAMTCAATVGGDAVRCFDANPQIVEDARRNFAANGLQAIAATAAVLAPATERKRWGSDAEFFISRDFWSSRLIAGSQQDDIIDRVRIPVLGLEDQIREHRANVLICDIEGGEAELLTTADLDGIQKLILETHYWAVGKAPIARLLRTLVAAGFDMDLDLSRHHVSYFSRDTPKAPLRRPMWRRMGLRT